MKLGHKVREIVREHRMACVCKVYVCCSQGAVFAPHHPRTRTALDIRVDILSSSVFFDAAVFEVEGIGLLIVSHGKSRLMDRP